MTASEDEFLWHLFSVVCSTVTDDLFVHPLDLVSCTTFPFLLISSKELGRLKEEKKIFIYFIFYLWKKKKIIKNTHKHTDMVINVYVQQQGRSKVHL